MLIYHGSSVSVPQPKILSANHLLDFGQGFYTTSSLEQAQRWARRVRERKKAKDQVLSVYEFDDAKAENELKIIRFDSPSPEWLRFVTACRTGKEIEYEYDLVMGPVANDNVYATVQLYEAGLLSEAETIIRLKIEKIFNQILFHTEKALQYIAYLRYEDVKDEQDG